MPSHPGKKRTRPPKIPRKRLTLIGTQVTALAALRNPTAAITARGGLIAKTRKPGSGP